jgi:hypothetical protein
LAGSETFAGAIWIGLVATGALAGMPCAGATELFWARTGVADGRKAIAAAKKSQRESKRGFCINILGIPCLFCRTGRE